MIKRSLLLLLFISLTGCSNIFLGDDNLDEPVDLPDNPKAIQFINKWDRGIGNGTSGKEIKLYPEVFNNALYVVSADQELSAYSIDDGKLTWRIDTGNSIASGVAVDSNAVIVASDNGQLIAFDTEDGEFLWAYQLSSEILSRPLATNGIVVARTIDGEIVGIDINNGQSIWKNLIDVSDLSIRGNANPVFLQGLVIFATSRGKLNVYNILDGKKAFTAPVAIGRGQTEVERIVDLLATPVVSDGILYVSSYRNETLAIDLKDSSLLWRSDLSSSKDLFVNDKLIYLIDKNSIIKALDKHTGKISWETGILKGRRISPLSGDQSKILVTDYKGVLSVLDAKNGRLLGYKSIGDEKSYIAPIHKDNNWITYTSDGSLSVFQLEYK